MAVAVSSISRRASTARRLQSLGSKPLQATCAGLRASDLIALCTKLEREDAFCKRFDCSRRVILTAAKATEAGESGDQPYLSENFHIPYGWLEACEEKFAMKTIPTLKSRILKFALPVIGCLSMLGLTSCGTMHGFGDDVETAGEEIQDAAN